MNTFNLYSLIEQRKWTEFLKNLELGEHTFLFPSISDIKSCKAIGYDINSDGVGRKYFFSVEKQERKLTITVKDEGNGEY